MRISRFLIVVLTVLSLATSTAGTLAAPASDGAPGATDGASVRRLLERRALRGAQITELDATAEDDLIDHVGTFRRFHLKRDDLISASGKADVLLRIRTGKKRVKVVTVPLGTRLKPQGMAINNYCEEIAIANGKNVVLLSAWKGTYQVIGGKEFFGFVADVEFDMHCNVLIADMGREAVGRWPRDGMLFKYVRETGELRQIGTRHHNWYNPSYMSLDIHGNLYVIDEEAGPKMPGRGEMYFDAIYKLGMPDFRWAKAVYKGPGIVASSLMVHPSGDYWVGRGDDFVIVDRHDMRLREPCGDSAPFKYVSGIAINTKLQVLALDGFDLYDGTRLHTIDSACDVQVMPAKQGQATRLGGAQGLAASLPAR